MRSRASVRLFEDVAVFVMDSDHAAESVDYQISGLDPAPDLALRGQVARGELRDGREF